MLVRHPWCGFIRNWISAKHRGPPFSSFRSGRNASYDRRSNQDERERERETRCVKVCSKPDVRNNLARPRSYRYVVKREMLELDSRPETCPTDIDLISIGEVPSDPSPRKVSSSRKFLPVPQQPGLLEDQKNVRIKNSNEQTFIPRL